MRGRVAALSATLLLAASSPAGAQEQPPAPTFAPRPLTWSWDKTSLRFSLTFREIVDAAITEKLNSGIPTTFVFRAVLVDSGSKAQVSLVLKSCRVVYDVWDEVYKVETRQEGSAPGVFPAIATLEGVFRKCTQVDKMRVAERAQLKVGGSYVLQWIVEVNPVSPDLMDRIKRWISRPKGSTTVGAGDALFGSFVGLFVAQIGNADRTAYFQSKNPVVVPAPPPPPPPPKKLEQFARESGLETAGCRL